MKSTAVPKSLYLIYMVLKTKLMSISYVTKYTTQSVGSVNQNNSLHADRLFVNMLTELIFKQGYGSLQ